MRLFFAANVFVLASLMPMAAGAGEIEDGIANLLEVGWSSSPKARLEGAKAFKLLLQQSPNDARIAQAYVLVLIKQRRYRDADQWIGRLVSENPRDSSLLKTRAWLSTINRHFDRALIECEQLSKLIGQQRGDSSTADAAMIGRIVGVIEGPGQTTLPERTLRQHRAKITDNLADPLDQAFEQGRAEVLEQYQQLSEQKDQVRQEAIQEAEQRREQQREFLTRQREQLADDQNAVSERRDELDAQLERRLNDLAATDEPLQDSLIDLDRQARRIETDLYYADRSAARALSFLHHYDDPFLSHQWLYELDRLDLLRDRSYGALLAADIEASSIALQRRQLRQRTFDARRSYQTQQSGLDNETRRITRTRQRIAHDERKLNRRLSGNNHRVMSLSAHAGAITTYLPYPVEQEKQRLLRPIPLE